MNPLVVAARETGNVLRSFWRNLWGAFFTILLPVMLLVLFGAINRDGTCSSARMGRGSATPASSPRAYSGWPSWPAPSPAW
jgi:hypothetical protein